VVTTLTGVMQLGTCDPWQLIPHSSLQPAVQAGPPQGQVVIQVLPQVSLQAANLPQTTGNEAAMQFAGRKYSVSP
jgi:hypothetical protein